MSAREPEVSTQRRGLLTYATQPYPPTGRAGAAQEVAA